MTYEEAKQKLNTYGQGHLLAFWDRLDEEGRQRLLNAISRLDFSVLDSFARPQDLSGKGCDIRPIAGLSVEDRKARAAEYRAVGNAALRAGKVAGLLLAGGQGTRLGVGGAKGAFNIGVTRSLSVFACQMQNAAEQLKESGAFPYLLIMTGEKNDEETRSFWQKNGYFGYPEEKIRFFVQDTSPCLDFSGKMFLEETDTPACSPNGNGGWFSSLKRSGLYDELTRSGVEWLNVYAVDNVLQRPFDPEFIGATILAGVNCGAKAVKKNDPHEKVGVLCEKDGAPAVIEYYELTEETANSRNEKGELLYSYGAILNYLFSLRRLEETAGEKVPVHIVKKKIPYVDFRGEKVVPEKENGLKFETLAVDLIAFMGSVLPYEVKREEEFAPVKNPTGVDSVETARAALLSLGVRL